MSLVFPSGKPGGEIFLGNLAFFEIPVSREIYVGILGKFFTLARISLVLISIIPT